MRAPGRMDAWIKGIRLASLPRSICCTRMRPNPLGGRISTAMATRAWAVWLWRPAAPIGCTRSVSARQAFIDLHLPLEEFAVGVHHGAAQPVQQSPGGLITAQPEHALQAQGADPVLWAGDVPDGGEPHAQFGPGFVENRARRGCCLVPARGANQSGTAQAPKRRDRSAPRADPSLRPAQLFQIVPARLLGAAMPPSQKLYGKDDVAGFYTNLTDGPQKREAVPARRVEACPPFLWATLWISWLKTLQTRASPGGPDRAHFLSSGRRARCRRFSPASGPRGWREPRRRESTPARKRRCGGRSGPWCRAAGRFAGPPSSQSPRAGSAPKSPLAARRARSASARWRAPPPALRAGPAGSPCGWREKAPPTRSRWRPASRLQVTPRRCSM
jgi:hypothetical protein